MNHDFLIPATPGIARSLMRLMASRMVSVDPAILALTNDGLYSDADFATLPVRPDHAQTAALQTLRDFDHHAVLLEPRGAGRPAIDTLVMACALADLGPVTLFTGAPQAWGAMSTHEIDCRSYAVANLSALADRRGGLLVLDIPPGTLPEQTKTMIHGLVSEFRRTIIVGAVGRQWWTGTDVCELASFLSPNSPTHLLTVPRTATGLQKNLALSRQLGVNTKRAADIPNMFAFLFNVCTDLIPRTHEFVINNVEPNEDLHTQYP